MKGSIQAVQKLNILHPNRLLGQLVRLYDKINTLKKTTTQYYKPKKSSVLRTLWR